jgi:DNA-binding response OmpR family regulator
VGHPKKVIIVDDDRETRELLKESLEVRGFNVVQAQSGLRLISYLHVDRPDVILLDVMMSWIDGFELCRAIKRNPEFRNIPVCFISGRSDPGDIAEGLSCGAAAYFVKPLDTDELVAKVAQLAEVSGEAQHPA